MIEHDEITDLAYIPEISAQKRRTSSQCYQKLLLNYCLLNIHHYESTTFFTATYFDFFMQFSEK
jgi:hypothetical protein